MPDSDSFVEAYIEMLLWSEHDLAEDGSIGENFEDYDASDIAPDSLAEIKTDCAAFVALAERIFGTRVSSSSFAHNFCLTRNGHGAGFWDGDFDYLDSDPEILAKLESDEFAHWTRGTLGSSKSARTLTSMAKSFGRQSLYLGDDGRLHTCG